MTPQTLTPKPLTRVLVAAGAVIAVAALAACGSEAPPTVGAAPGAPQTVAGGAGDAGLTTGVNNDIDVIDARIPAPSAGSTTAQVEVTLADINAAGPDTLLSATSPAARAITFTRDGHAIAGITIPVADGVSISTGPPNPDRILLTGLRTSLRSGQSVTISLVFARAGRATLRVPVVPAVP